MNNLHPIFQQALRPFAPPAQAELVASVVARNSATTAGIDPKVAANRAARDEIQPRTITGQVL